MRRHWRQKVKKQSNIDEIQVKPYEIDTFIAKKQNMRAECVCVRVCTRKHENLNLNL